MTILPRVRHILAPIFFVLCAPLHATSADSVADAALATIHKVAVVSTLGDTLTDGRTKVIRGSQSPIDISEWRLNDRVDDLVSKAAAGRLMVEPLHLVGPSIKLHYNMINLTPTPDTKWAATLPKGDFDAYIIIYAISDRPPIGAEGASPVVGIGVHRAYEGILPDDAAVYAHYAVAVVRASDGKTLVAQPAKSDHHEKFKLSSLLYMKPDPITPWDPMPTVPPDWPEMTPETQADVRSRIEALLDRSIPQTIAALGLAGTAP